MKKIRHKAYTSVTLRSFNEERKFLESILSSKERILLPKIDKPMVLFGGGQLGRLAKDFFMYLNTPFLYVVDVNAVQYRKEKHWEGTKIICPNDVPSSDKKNYLLVVCIVTTPFIELRDRLKKEGWKDVIFFYDVVEAFRSNHPLNNGWILNRFTELEKREIKKIFCSFSDDVSRAHYVRFLAWHRLRIDLFFKYLNDSVDLDDRFFISEIRRVLTHKEVFVDCGAHTGTVIRKFLKMVRWKYRRIYAFEPDNTAFKILAHECKNVRNIEISRCALASRAGTKSFYEGFGLTSKLGKNGKSSVMTISLDESCIRDVTFIKMHLEGGELDALRGSIKTIQKCRPIIAVTVYHNSDGVWKTPIFLMKNTKAYDFYMRLHSWGGTGAVLYAVPKERTLLN